MMPSNFFSQTLLLLACTLSVSAFAEDAVPEIEGSQIEHTSIYNGECIRAIHKDNDLTNTCSPVIAIMYLANGRVVVNLEYGDHQAISLYARPSAGSTSPLQHLLLSRITTASSDTVVEGKCVLSHQKKARSLTCTATSTDGLFAFEFEDVSAVSAEKK